MPLLPGKEQDEWIAQRELKAAERTCGPKPFIIPEAGSSLEQMLSAKEKAELDWKKARAELAEMQVSERKKELVSLEEICQVAVRKSQEIALLLRALPRNVCEQAALTDSAAECERIIGDAIEGILAKVAGMADIADAVLDDK